MSFIHSCEWERRGERERASGRKREYAIASLIDRCIAIYLTERLMCRILWDGFSTIPTHTPHTSDISVTRINDDR